MSASSWSLVPVSMSLLCHPVLIVHPRSPKLLALFKRQREAKRNKANQIEAKQRLAERMLAQQSECVELQICSIFVEYVGYNKIFCHYGGGGVP